MTQDPTRPGSFLRTMGAPKGLLLFLGLALILFLGLEIFTWRTGRTPVLVPGLGAEWIRREDPFILNARRTETLVTVFRTRFTAARPEASPELSFRAMKQVVVLVDKKKVFEDRAPLPDWNRTRTIRLPPVEDGEPHELILVVLSSDSHPCLLAASPALGIRTGTHWEASHGDRVWSRAIRVQDAAGPELARAFPSTWAALGASWKLVLAAFALGAGWAWLHHLGRARIPSPATLRWLLMGALGLLGLNNFFKLPLHLGMDLPTHLDYVRFIAEGRGLPLATDGWQMFQPPLYYLLSTPLHLLFRTWGPQAGEYALRLIPWSCGLLQVELAHRILRETFPGEEGSQRAGLLLASLLPVNLTMSQVHGNEPLSGVLASLAILLVVRRLGRPDTLLEPRFALALGSVLGLALLTKTSNLLLVALLPILCVIWSSAPAGTPAGPGRGRAALRFLFLGAGALLLVAGWWFARNWWRLGRPMVNGWDQARGFSWWQDPGAWPLSSLWSFGRALVHPIYAQASGIWNGLYGTFWTDGSICSVVEWEFRPPWNYNLLIGSVLLSLVPMATMLFGSVVEFRKRQVQLSILCILIFLAAIFHLHVTDLAAYSTLKASYLLGLLPCFAVLGGAGFRRLSRDPAPKILWGGLMGAWATLAFFGFWIRS
ncbi:MAG: hypothetical protein HY823_04990 [Acidobacteria bacterium]|nr:hypothetical protein [Acidobacteriota bacterium]